MKLYEDLKDYQPKNEQEETDRKAMLAFIEKNDDCLCRENLVGHFTSSAIVVNETIDKVLFAHHNIYNSWAWVGGHNDGDDDALFVAIKEAKEETGIKNVIPLAKDIAGIDNIYVMSHMKKGKYVGDHIHFNITYILVTSEEEELVINADENSGVKWFGFNEVLDMVNEERMKPVYKKLIDYAISLK